MKKKLEIGKQYIAEGDVELWGDFAKKVTMQDEIVTVLAIYDDRVLVGIGEYDDDFFLKGYIRPETLLLSLSQPNND
ncbi:MAG: hypothetical protein DRP97_03580 [Candidatus Latescibacterota bacterium]|nr:MAG: hypothetical protein DRP97_03580 [Candidatus Latescibacterota bacterium]